MGNRLVAMVLPLCAMACDDLETVDLVRDDAEVIAPNDNPDAALLDFSVDGGVVDQGLLDEGVEDQFIPLDRAVVDQGVVDAEPVSVEGLCDEIQNRAEGLHVEVFLTVNDLPYGADPVYLNVGHEARLSALVCSNFGATFGWVWGVRPRNGYACEGGADGANMACVMNQDGRFSFQFNAYIDTDGDGERERFPSNVVRVFVD